MARKQLARSPRHDSGSIYFQFIIADFPTFKNKIKIKNNLILQVFLGSTGAHDTDGNELPRLVYVSREKRPGYQHHKKAGAENALVCVFFSTPLIYVETRGDNDDDDFVCRYEFLQFSPMHHTSSISTAITT